MNQITKNIIGKSLKSIRKNHNLTQFALAEKAGLSFRHYQNIEYGKVNFRIDTLERILQIYNIDLLYFFKDHLHHETAAS